MSGEIVKITSICDCERGHNGIGMAGRECDCDFEKPPEPAPVDAEVEALRLFVTLIKRWKGEPYSLGEIRINGRFSRFYDPDTDNAWIGFCMARDASQAEAAREKAAALGIIEEHALVIKRLEDENAALQKRVVELEGALEECEEYFDNRADADCDQDGFIPNKEMRLLAVIRDLGGKP